MLRLVHEHRADVHAENTRKFQMACAEGNEGTVKALLQLEGLFAVNVHSDGWKALMAACRNGHLCIVKKLLSLRGAFRMDAFARKRYAEALTEACWGGHVGVVRELLATKLVWGTSDLPMAFRVSCRGGHFAVIHELMQFTLKHCPQPFCRVQRALHDGLCEACEGGHIELVHALLRITGPWRIQLHNVYDDALASACIGGHVNVVKKLLRLTRHLRVAGDSTLDETRAFLSACRYGHVQVLQELLALGEQCRFDLRASGQEGFEAACWGGHVEVVRALVHLKGDQCIDVRADKDAGFRAAACVLRATVDPPEGSQYDVLSEDRVREYESVLSELLALPPGRCPSLDSQAAHLGMCVRVIAKWTESVQQLRHCSTSLDALHPELRSMLSRGPKNTAWQHRRAVVCKRCMQRKRGASREALPESPLMQSQTKMRRL